MLHKNVEKLIRILFLLLLNSNFLFSQCEDCIESLELLSKRATLLNVSYTKSLTQKDSLLERITHLNNEITLYRTGLKYPVKGLAPLVDVKNRPVMPEITETNTIITKPKDDSQNKVFLDAINKSKKEISILQKSLTKAKNTVATNKREIDNLQKVINKLSEEISSQNSKSKALEDEIFKLESILDCIKKFETDIKRPSLEIANELVKIRADFTEFKRLKLIKSTKMDLMESLISRVIIGYDSYKGVQREMICGDITLFVFQDYLIVDDYYNIAEIYCKNYGNAVKKISGTNQINEANRRILNSIAIIMEKGTYEQISEVSRNLDRCVTKETRSGSINSEVIANYNEVVKLYEKGSYLESIIMYDKIEKFSELDELDQIIVLKAKTYIGQIILWDLTDLGENLANLLKGDWLKCELINSTCKKEILTEVVEKDIRNFSNNDKKALLLLQKQAFIAINKYYE